MCSACLWSVAYSCAVFILGQFVCSVSCRTVVCTCAVSHLSVLCSCAVYVCGQLCVYVLFESLFSCVFVCSVCLCSVECCVLSEFLVSCVHELCMSSSVMCLCALVSHWSIVCCFFSVFLCFLLVLYACLVLNYPSKTIMPRPGWVQMSCEYIWQPTADW